MTTITLLVEGIGLDMPAATTAKYAAKRVAEVFGLDPGDEYILVADGEIVDQDAIVEELHLKPVELGVVEG